MTMLVSRSLNHLAAMVPELQKISMCISHGISQTIYHRLQEQKHVSKHAFQVTNIWLVEAAEMRRGTHNTVTSASKVLAKMYGNDRKRYRVNG